MARIITDKELSHLTIARLKALLKAARARWHARAFCDCCGEPYEELYRPGSSRFSMEDYNDMKAHEEYVDRIKKQLSILQKQVEK